VLGRDPLATFPWGHTQLLWIGAGIVYAGLMLLATLHLRADLDYGFVAMIFVFAVVWGSDIVAYFVGRALGGPKLMPRVSPSKTWSGAIGGTAASIVAGVLVAKTAGIND